MSNNTMSDTSREFLSAYISGYVDGEGCFTVSISPRAKLLVGWAVRPGFSVNQNGDRAEVLHAIRSYLGCEAFDPTGASRPSSGRRRRLEDILERVLPHFEWYPLLSSKRYDFDRFASICLLMADGAHRRRDGLVEIVELASG
jgi:hypothetical protein